MSNISIEKLYECHEIIAGEDSSESEKFNAFHLILSGIKAGDKEKRLASQLIGRFFKMFPDLQDKCFNFILDLCDDDNRDIRCQAVRDLQIICKSDHSYLLRVSDVLSQMLSAADVSEARVIGLGLQNLLEIDAKIAVAGIFNQMLSDKSESPRDCIIKFLSENLKRLPENKLTPELEEFIVEKTNKVLQDVSETEFIQLISVMSTLKCMSSLTGRQKLVGMITNQVIQAVPVFNPSDLSCVAQVRESGKQAVRFLSKNVSAGAFLNYFLHQVVPNIGRIQIIYDQTSLLRLLAEISNHPGDCFVSVPQTDCIELLTPLYEILLENLPDVPADPTSSLAVGGCDSKLGESASLMVFTIECLIYTLLNLTKFCPIFLGLTNSAEDGDDVLKEGTKRLQNLRQKMQYSARLIQSFKPDIVAKLQAVFQGDDRSADCIASEAKRALANIEALIRCLFRSKIDRDVLGALVLSWIAPKAGEKRAAPLTTTTPHGGKQQAVENRIYHAPSGRWSGVPRSRGRRWF